MLSQYTPDYRTVALQQITATLLYNGSCILGFRLTDCMKSWDNQRIDNSKEWTSLRAFYPPFIWRYFYF